MLFPLLGRVTRRCWFLMLAGWALLVLATWYFAPKWADVAQDKQFSFLPDDAPSRRAQEVYATAFPDDKSASNIVLVLHRDDQRDLAGDLNFIHDVLEPGLRRIADDQGGLVSQAAPSEDERLFDDEPAPPPQPRPQTERSIMYRIRTPNAPGAGALLVSPDHKALLVVIELTTEFTSHANWPTITRVEDLVGDLKQQGKLPEGLDIAVTGSAVIGRDHSLAELRSARATGLLTVVLVVVLLIVIYRAPLLALIPLGTVYLSVQVALNLLAMLAARGYLEVFQGIEIYITILAYGAGVDYSLFLTARYKEELDRGAHPSDAIAAAVGGVGAALTASALTVICGISMMWFARFGKFREAGLAIPLCLLLVLLATLTFSPALLRLAGRWAFWPQHQPSPEEAAEPEAEGWKAWLTGAALRRVWDRVGHVLLRRPGTVFLATVGVMAPFAVVAGLFYDRLSYDVVGNLPADAPSVTGTRVLQEHFPAGVLGTATVLLVNPDVDFDGPDGRAVVARLTERLEARKDELGVADVRSLTAPLGTMRGTAGLDLANEARKEAAERAARDRYVTDLGERAKVGTRLEVVLAESPFSREGITALGRVEQAIRDELPPEARGGARLYVLGTTASVRDLADVMRQDRTRIELLVLVSVFLVLVVLLRRVVTPVYLLLSVLFSFYVTLGVAFVLFWALDPQGFTGIDWKVAIFLFTILIAVGEDYNIFLMARVDEEEERYGTPRGITEALTRTGPIISSCGIIMAGTFASLLAGSLTEMKQLGFALAFGVLLDTFVVRPILVPAFLVLLRTGRLSPSAWLRRRPRPRAEARRAEEARSSS
jgi:putative drug exporter of the RND superfamily